MKILHTVLFSLSLLLAASATYAQQTKVKVDVPFSFYAGDRIYPAGEYLLSSTSINSSVLRIDGDPEVQSAFLPSIACAALEPSGQTKLVFHRVGSSYFLSQVWVEGNSRGREFPRTRTQTLLARNGEQPETTIIAARLVR